MTTTKPKKERITLFIDPDIKKQLKILATISGTTVSQLLEQLVARTQHEKTNLQS